MFGIILGIILLVAGIVAGVSATKEDYKVAGTLLPIGGIVACIICILLACITSIPTGHTGVLTTFGRVENYTLDAGIHFKSPFQNVIKMDNRTQRQTIELACFSSDIQEVNIKYTVNYRIDTTNAMNIYKTIGKDYYATAIAPNVSESVKVVTARYTAENLVSSRDTLAAAIEAELSAQLERYNIQIVSTAIEDMDFTDAFTNAVEAKQVAAQNKLKAETEQAQKTMEAAQEAERKKIEANAAAEVAKIAAEADLEVTKIQADAAEYAGQKEAEKNKKIKEYLDDKLIEYYYIQQWDGKLPENYAGSENVTSVMGIK